MLFLHFTLGFFLPPYLPILVRIESSEKNVIITSTYSALQSCFIYLFFQM